MIFVVDIISSIVADVRAEYDTVNVPEKEPYFLYGHPLEIVNILKNKAKSSTLKSERFPLVCLFTDIKEEKRNDGYLANVRINMAIVEETKPEYTAAQRKAETFTKVLYPLHDLFIKYLKRNTSVSVNAYLEYDKYDRYFWGKEGLYGSSGNIFDDFVDAIEIQNMLLKINPENC